MTLHGRISSRIAYSAGLVRFAAFIKANPGLPIDQAEQTFPVKSKAEADQIAEAYGASTRWRNGYYMAETEVGSLRWELHFTLPITEQDAA